MRAAHAGAQRAAGFTLIELVAVVLIIAIATGLAAVTMTGGLDGMRLRSASSDIAAQLRYTRVQAIATGRRKEFTIDPHGHTWEAPKHHRGKVPRQLGIEFYGAREVQPSPGEGGIAFFPDGASTGGRIRLRAKNAVRDVDVAWLTGEVRVKRGERQ